MSVSVHQRPPIPRSRDLPRMPFDLVLNPSRGETMYAIAFDLDTELLKEHYGSESYNNAYADIRKLLTTKHHFKWQQGSVYFGDPKKVNAVTCVLAAMDLARTFAWFSLAVRDIRMLRIEEQNDLMGAIREAAPTSD